MDLKGIIVGKITVVNYNERQSELKALLCVFTDLPIIHTPFPKNACRTLKTAISSVFSEGRVSLKHTEERKYWNQLKG